MKLQQLRYLCEVARRDLSVSAAAETLKSRRATSHRYRSCCSFMGFILFESNIPLL